MTWNLQNLRGSRETVKTAIAGAKNIPQPTKDFLSAQVDSLPAEVSACRLDAYCQDLENKADMRLTRNIQVTLVGVKV